MKRCDPLDDGVTSYVPDHEPPKASQSSVLPVGISAWDQVLRNGETAAPWPYSQAQWDEICRRGDLSNVDLQTIVLLAARRYIFVERSLEKRPATLNDGNELATLVGAVASLRSALKGLGDGAFEHLAAHRDGGPPRAHRPEPLAAAEAREAARVHFRRVRAQELVQDNLTAIEWALDRFERDNAAALAAPPQNRRGRPSRTHEKWLHWRLGRVFRLAHPSKKQPQGLPRLFQRVR